VCNVGKGSADGDGGVQSEFEGRKSRPRSADRDSGVPMQRGSPSRLSSAEWGGRNRVWNDIEAHLIQVEAEIEGPPSKRRSADRQGSIER
jgi:hypothetical protein